MKPLDPRLLRYARASVGYLLVCGAIGTVTALLVLAQAHLLATAIADAVHGRLHTEDLTRTLTLLAGVVLARAVVAWASEGAAAAASARVKSTLRRRLTTHVLALGPSWLADERAGSLTVLITKGLDALDVYFSRYLPQLVLAVTVPGLIVSALLAVDLLSALTVIATVPLIPVFMVLIGWVTQEKTRRRWRALSVLSYHFADIVAGLPTLKLFNRARAQAEGIRRVSDAHRQQTQATLRVAFCSSLVLELLATLSVALVAVGVGLRLLQGGLDLQVALLVLILAPEAYAPLRAVGTHFHASADGLAAAEEAFRVLETAPARAAGTGTAVPDLRHAPIQVREVAIDYPGRDDPAVRGLSFQVRPGEIVALSGPSGAGKSSVISLLLGFTAPARGQVWVGDSDLSDLDPAVWRRHTAWVPQHPHLVAGSVADNVALGEPQARTGEVRHVLRTAGADELDPDRVLGVDGAGLSVGERRRVALARALLRTSRVDGALALLDEPSAGLDDETERAVVDAVALLRSWGHPIVLVAHRPRLVALADRVVGLTAPGADQPWPRGQPPEVAV